MGLDLGLSGSIVPRVWLGSEGEGEIGCTISGCLDGSGVIAIRVNQTQTHDKKGTLDVDPAPLDLMTQLQAAVRREGSSVWFQG